MVKRGHRVNGPQASEGEGSMEHFSGLGEEPAALLSDAGLEPHRPNHPDLETEVAQSTAQVVIDGDGLRLQQLAMGQQHPKFLTTQRLHMHRAVKPNPHHLGDAARIVAVSLVNLRLQRRPHVPRLDTDRRQACFGQRTEQPLRQWPCSNPMRLKW